MVKTTDLEALTDPIEALQMVVSRPKVWTGPNHGLLASNASRCRVRFAGFQETADLAVILNGVESLEGV